MAIPERSVLLGDLMRRRILVLDGAMGTHDPDAGPQGRGLRRPRVRGLQRAPRPHPAGRDPRASTRTISRRAPTSSRPTPSAPRRWCWPSIGLAHKAPRDQRRGAARLAREAADGCRRRRTAALGGRLDRPDHQGDHASPAASPSRSWSDTSRRRRAGWSRAASDYLLIETCQDTRNVKAALLGVEQAFARGWRRRVPVAVSGTIEPMGTMLAGQSVEALCAPRWSTSTCSTSASTAPPAPSS